MLVSLWFLYQWILILIRDLGTNADDGILGTQAIAVVQNSVVQGKPANSGSSRDQSDDDEGEGEVETNDSLDPADAKRFRRLF